MLIIKMNSKVGTMSSLKLLGLMSAATAVLGVLAAPIASAAVSIQEYTITTSNSGPWGIAAGSDGNMWFTEGTSNKIAKITTAGVITEYAIPTGGSGTTDIAAGADGNLWFTEENSNKIGKITTSGTITEYSGAGTNPFEITAGPDGNMWYTVNAYTSPSNSRIGKITPSGTITQYTIPTANSEPAGIAAGSDGNMWFTEATGKIGKMTTSGVATEYTLPGGRVAYFVVAGPDGNIWFGEGTNKIGKITPSGTITEYNLASGRSVSFMAAGPDGNIWFTDGGNNKVSSITMSGTVTEYDVPTAGSAPLDIAAGPDNNMWFVQQNGNKVGKVILPTDWDNDSLANSDETGAPNNGDANGDGTPDAWQANVTSLSNTITKNYSVLQSSCSTNTDTQISGESPLDPDSAYSYPAGLVGFKTVCGSPGATATITQYYYGTYTADTFVLRQWNASNHTYQTIPGAVLSNVTIGGQAALKVVYQITDGSAFDQDGIADGNIVDPVGPALASTAPATGYGAPSKNNKLSIALLGASALLIGFGLRLRYRQTH